MTDIQNYYTISDFENIYNSGIDYKLPESVTNVFKYLLQELNIREPSHPPAFTRTSSEGFSRPDSRRSYPSGNSDRKPSRNDRGGRNGAKEINNEDWEALTNFKTTKIVSAEGIDKRINEIRVVLNKISAKTYETQKEIILKSIGDFIDLENYETKSQDIEKLTNIVFDIITHSKFLSELNADLYSHLYNKFTIFKELLNTNLEKFHHSIDSINYADPNTDYDEYCKYIKINDSRKSETLFYINLYKKKIIDITQIFTILEYFLTKSTEYVDMENKSNELEEITENVFIIISNIVHDLIDNEDWENKLFPMVDKLAKMKAKEHKSLTNRVVFKYMDIIDLVDE